LKIGREIVTQRDLINVDLQSLRRLSLGADAIQNHPLVVSVGCQASGKADGVEDAFLSGDWQPAGRENLSKNIVSLAVIGGDVLKHTIGIHRIDALVFAIDIYHRGVRVVVNEK